MDYKIELDFAKELGQQAYKIAQKYYKNNPTTEIKDDNSPVTIADKEINQLVIDRVKEQFPSHGVLGEEQSYGLDSEYLWVCDPIDGTLAYTLGISAFMFSIALVKNGEPVLSLITDLSTNESTYATKGNGAYMENVKISVSTRPLANAHLLSPRSPKDVIENSPYYTQLLQSSTSVSATPGCVFKGQLISQGVADGAMWLRKVNAWDMAAIVLIIREAGGKATDMYGNNEINCTKSVDGLVISNGACHDELLGITKEYLESK